MRKHHITAKQYHSPLANKTARLPYEKSRKSCRFYLTKIYMKAYNSRFFDIIHHQCGFRQNKTNIACFAVKNGILREKYPKNK